MKVEIPANKWNFSQPFFQLTQGFLLNTSSVIPFSFFLKLIPEICYLLQMCYYLPQIHYYLLQKLIFRNTGINYYHSLHTHLWEFHYAVWGSLFCRFLLYNLYGDLQTRSDLSHLHLSSLQDFSTLRELSLSHKTFFTVLIEALFLFAVWIQYLFLWFSETQT